MIRTIFVVLLYSSLVAAGIPYFPAGNNNQTGQVHIATGGDGYSEMRVMWATNIDPSNLREELSSVQYRTSDGEFISVNGKMSKLVSRGQLRMPRTSTTHEALLSPLKPNTQYYYRVPGVEKEFSFTTLSENAKQTTYAVYGDLGLKNGQSIPLIQKDVESGIVDAVIHVGDIAYNLADNEGRVGDSFMQIIEPIASRVPYFVCAGNHERYDNYTQYTQRFSGMPSESSPGNWYYSFNVGLVHWVAIHTEIYMYDGNKDLIQQQWEWLKADLEAANAQRHEQPWIIVFGHRPLYCSNGGAGCGSSASTLRDGIDGKGKYGFEEMFQEYGVDIYFSGHLHDYERMYPVHKHKVEKHDRNLYVNPTAPTYIVAGSAGCQEKHSHFFKKIGDFSAFHSIAYGYGRLRVENATHIYYEEVTTDGGEVQDSVWIVQQNHGRFTASQASLSKAAEPAGFYAAGMGSAENGLPGGCAAARKCDDEGCMCVLEEADNTCKWEACPDVHSSLRGVVVE